jgi:ATP-dependent RNA helicase DBP3
VEDNPIGIQEKKSKKSKKDKKDKRENSEGKEGGEEVEESPAKLKSAPNTEESRYIENDHTGALSLEEAQELRNQWNITIHPNEETDLYKPITRFDYLRNSVESLCPYIMEYIQRKNFTQPTPIQSQCWPPLLSGRDVIGIAATGSGKTLAFLIPALLKITYLQQAQLFPRQFMNQQQQHSTGPGRGRNIAYPSILIVAPTRELAMQSQQVIEEVGSTSLLRGICLYGGVPKDAQRQELRRGMDIVVATPGRLLDLMEEQTVSMANVRYLVLDEADRMLDEGFEPAINKIIATCPSAISSSSSSTTSTVVQHPMLYRQTVMFSATWPESIRQLAEKYLKPNVIRITVGSEELCANHRVTQIVEIVQQHEKDRKLLSLLDKYHATRKNRILIFVLYKKEAADLQYRLQQRGYAVTGIHGDKSQHDRTAALDEFKRGQTPLLIATDVAARGLDIPQVEYVINYSFPLTTEDYVHRIGRTGRGGATGVSHTFFTDNDKTLAASLVAVLQEAKQQVPPEIYKYPMFTKKKQTNVSVFYFVTFYYLL